MQLPENEDIEKSSFNEKKQPDQEILLGHYFLAELAADSHTGWKGQTYETEELFPFPKWKGKHLF